jgi:hypothetical protein
MRDAGWEGGLTWPQAFHDVGMGFVGLGTALVVLKYLKVFLVGE